MTTHIDKSVGLPYTTEGPHPVELSDLEELHEQHARQTWWARVTLLSLVFGMLALNLWMTQRSYDALMADVDASRTGMSEVHEQTSLRLEAIEARLTRIEARLDQPVAVAVAADPQ